MYIMLRRWPLFIFDLSGTVMDANCLGPLSFLKRAFEANGVSVSEREIMADMGNSKLRHIELLLHKKLGQEKKSKEIYRSYLKL